MTFRTHLASVVVGSALTLGSLLVATTESHAGDRMRDWGYSGHGYNWSGLYFGGSLGGAWGDSSFVFANGNPANPNPIDFDGSFAGGFHLGLQHQWGNFVFGIEGSALITDLSGTSTCPNAAFSCSAETDWIWMIGPRVGYTMNNWLFYGTGGYAVGSIDTQTTFVATGVQFDSGHERHGGWYLGGGLEWGITRNLSLGIEYKHIELDDELHVSSTIPGSPGGDRSVDASIDVVQARLTLRMGRDEPRPERVPLK
jgi:outer membrane immunogenic protein